MAMKPWRGKGNLAHRRVNVPVRRLFAALLLALALGAGAQPVDFALKDMDGQLHRLSDHRGKWVVVNYWATWCPPCRDEMPELEQFHRSNPNAAVVLGVNMEDVDDALLRDFVARFGVSFPILRANAVPDPTELVGPVDGLPTTYLIAPSGKPVAREVGKVTADGLQLFIDRFNAKQAAAAP